MTPFFFHAPDQIAEAGFIERIGWNWVIEKVVVSGPKWPRDVMLECEWRPRVNLKAERVREAA